MGQKPFWEFYMNKSTHLRFLLALGGQKAVVFQEQKNLHIYASPVSKRNNVSWGHLSDTLQPK